METMDKLVTPASSASTRVVKDEIMGSGNGAKRVGLRNAKSKSPNGKQYRIPTTPDTTIRTMGRPGKIPTVASAAAPAYFDKQSNQDSPTKKAIVIEGLASVERGRNVVSPTGGEKDPSETTSEDDLPKTKQSGSGSFVNSATTPSKAISPIMTIDADFKKDAKEIISKIKSRKRRSGAIFMGYALTEDEDISVPQGEPVMAAEDGRRGTKKPKVETPPLDVKSEIPKRGRGRPRLSDQARAQSKRRSKKRARSPSPSESDSEGEDVPSVKIEIKGAKNKNYSRTPVKRSTSAGTPKKVRARISSDEEEVDDLTNLMKRQSISPMKSPPKPSPTAKSVLASKEIVGSKAHAPITIIQSQPALLSLSGTLSFTEKYFVMNRRCFLARNYFKVRSHLRKLTKGTLMKRKLVAPSSQLEGRKRLEFVVRKMTKGCAATYQKFRFGVPSLSVSDRKFVAENKLFLLRNQREVKHSSIYVAIGIHATRLPKNKGETGKKLVEDFFLRGSLGYHPGGMNVKCAVAGDGYNQKAGTVKRQDEDEAKCSLPDINALMDVELPESSGTPITASGKPTSLDLPDSSTENDFLLTPPYDEGGEGEVDRIRESTSPHANGGCYYPTP